MHMTVDYNFEFESIWTSTKFSSSETTNTDRLASAKNTTINHSPNPNHSPLRCSSNKYRVELTTLPSSQLMVLSTLWVVTSTELSVPTQASIIPLLRVWLKASLKYLRLNADLFICVPLKKVPCILGEKELTDSLVMEIPKMYQNLR